MQKTTSLKHLSCLSGTFPQNSHFSAGRFWLIVNHADSRGYDYPLTRVKHRLLSLIVPLLFACLAGLKPDNMTTCCGCLTRIMPVIQQRLTIITLISYLLFTLIVVWKMIFSALKPG
ncbi:MAG: hypothetical protein HGB32_08160 [Geobacteraceae bacterium]|nr:hypothetical protein [Geobacteraceae bacterium]NTW80106.1 hypothetical protein [Geobacteraceae bacterium]